MHGYRLVHGGYGREKQSKICYAIFYGWLMLIGRMRESIFAPCPMPIALRQTFSFN